MWAEPARSAIVRSISVIGGRSDDALPPRSAVVGRKLSPLSRKLNPLSPSVVAAAVATRKANRAIILSGKELVCSVAVERARETRDHVGSRGRRRGHLALFQFGKQTGSKSCGASAVGNWTVDHWCFLLHCIRTTAPEALKSWLQTCGQCINAIPWKTRLCPA